MRILKKNSMRKMKKNFNVSYLLTPKVKGLIISKP